MSKRVALLAFLVVLACCYVTGAAYGKQGGWQLLPFYGHGHGQITHLQGTPDSPSHLYLTAIATRDGHVIFAGTSAHGLFKSIDGGLHWQSVNQGLPIHDKVSGHYPRIATIRLEDNGHLYLCLSHRRWWRALEST